LGGSGTVCRIKPIKQKVNVASGQFLRIVNNGQVSHGEGTHIGSGRAYASADKTAREIELEREIGELRRE
jgi:hypothetical protein